MEGERHSGARSFSDDLGPLKHTCPTAQIVDMLVILFFAWFVLLTVRAALWYTVQASRTYRT